MKKTNILLLLLCTVLVTTGCAEHTPIDECLTVDAYGFWSGILHGFIAVFSFIISLFDDSVSMYAVNNTGHLYDLGFVLGFGTLGGGSVKLIS